MSSVKPISNLPNASATTGDELLPMVQSGTTRKITLSEITNTFDKTEIRANNTGTYRTGNINLVPGTNITITEGSGADIGKFTFNGSFTETQIRANDTGTYRDGNINLVAGTNVSITEGTGADIGKFTFAATTSITGTTTTLTGMINNLASQGTGGYDYMEWTSNATGTGSIPSLRMVQNLKLLKVSYVWLGDTALSVGTGESVAFTVRKLTAGTQSTIANYTSLGALFTLDSTDNNTFPNSTVTLGSPITISDTDTIAIIGQETGTVTPNNGELQFTFLFEIV
tara:strand:+ start:520 stop:1371 length:852 start_codon:yes stop_codon:yes gene_type:complete